jgi:3-hydroxyacyl-[acyl-carrier-protein] dehydratase
MTAVAEASLTFDQKSGVAEIVRRIPHRHPILLLDRVLQVEPGHRLSAQKAVTVAEPCYRAAGADTSDWAYPVALLIESLAQAAVLLAVWEQPNPDVLAGQVELAGGMREVRIHRPVYPGDVLEHRVELVRSIGDTAILAGSTTVAGEITLAVGHFVLALRDVETLRTPAPTRLV